MVLIEIFLPMYDNSGQTIAKSLFERVRGELAEKFGGVTAFTRSPATGLWADNAGQVHRDELAIFEVLVDAVDSTWWTAYRKRLEANFRQKEILVRATQCQRL